MMPPDCLVPKRDTGEGSQLGRLVPILVLKSGYWTVHATRRDELMFRQICKKNAVH